MPQVTSGSISSPSILISLSKTLSSSEYKVFQCAKALFQSSPFGDIGLFLKYSKVFSSGAIRPALAPPSIVMLQIVILCSTLRLRITSPANSIT